MPAQVEKYALNVNGRQDFSLDYVHDFITLNATKMH